MVRFMMGFVSLPIFFYGYALQSTYFILNKILSKFVSKISHEIWIGRKLALSHFKIWRCSAYIKCLKTDKLEPKSDKYLFVIYPKEIKRYYFYLTDE